MTGRYDTISMEQVISRIKMKLRLTDSSNDDYLNVLACEALDSMNAASQQGKFECPIKVCDRTAKLPKGIIKFLAARIPCDTENAATNDPITNQLINWNKQYPLIYADVTFLNQCGCNTSGMIPYANTIEINNGHIHFNSDMNIDEITVAFLGLRVDEFGNSIIFQRYERALTNYACAEYADSFKEDFTEGQIQRWNATWVAQKAKIEGEDRMNNFENDRFEIAALANGLMVSRNRLIFP